MANNSYLSYDKPRPESVSNSERVGGMVVYGQVTNVKPVKVHSMHTLTILRPNADGTVNTIKRLLPNRKLRKFMNKAYQQSRELYQP